MSLRPTLPGPSWKKGAACDFAVLHINLDVLAGGLLRPRSLVVATMRPRARLGLATLALMEPPVPVCSPMRRAV